MAMTGYSMKKKCKTVLLRRGFNPQGALQAVGALFAQLQGSLRWRGVCAPLLGFYLLTTGNMAVAENQPASAPPSVLAAGKIGVIDMQQVILNVEEGKKARAQLETEIKSKEAGLLKQKEELDKMNKEWKDQAPLLSEDARMKKQAEFQEKFLALRNAEMEYQAEIKRKEQKATQAIAMKVTQLVDSIAKSRKLVAVFETNSAGLLYLDSPIDLTQIVIAEYGKQPSPQQPVTKK